MRGSARFASPPSALCSASSMLTGHEQVPRRAQGAPQGHGVADVLVQPRRRQPGGNRLAEAMRIVELPPVRVERPPRARARSAGERAGGRTRTAPAPAGASRPAPPRGRRWGRPARIVSTSPASTAWCIRRARCGRSWARSTCTTAALSCRHRIAGRLRSIAQRAGWWRDATLLRADLEHAGALGLSSVSKHARAAARRGRGRPATGQRRAGRAHRGTPGRASASTASITLTGPRRAATPAPPSRRTGCRG